MSDMRPIRFGNFIDGADDSHAQGARFVSIDPTTGDEWGDFPDSDPGDVDRAVRAAQRAFEDGPWGRLSPTRRGRLLMRWGDKIAENAERIAAMEVRQNGKLMAEMRTQAVAAQDWLYYFGGLADKIEGQVIPLDRTSVFNYTLLEPLGVVAVIVPWNSPTFITMMASCPALAAGNTIVIKPSEVTSASALELARLAIEAGLPPGVVNVVTGLRQTGEALVDHPLVRKVNFTGSDAAGRAIAARAGGRLIETVQELGGKSAHIVFGDADLDQAEAGVLSGIFAAAGQTCVAGSRVFVHADCYDALAARMVERAKGIVIGDPMLPATQMGPAATKAQLDKNLSMVEHARQEGGRVLCGGERLKLAAHPNGYFFAPTIFEGSGAGDFLNQNEVFGPIMTLTRFHSDDEVVGLANDTRFGLAAGVWTRDVKRAHLLARRLKAGTIWINTYRAMAFNSPFGGFKDSGFGKQNGVDSVRQYLQTKSVWCELSDEIRDPFVLKA